ncbi:hypothetical protein HK101_004624 [Irineochytrium annulatum]|nr:hypothetical protein HK101_004624 [Irineochytrium annulatum]
MGVNVICFIEGLQRMHNPHVFYSMCAYSVTHIVTMTLAGLACNAMVYNNIAAYQQLSMFGSVIFIVMQGCLTYHSSMRTMLVITPYAKRPWLIPLLVTFVQYLLDLIAGYYWYLNLVDNSHSYENDVMNIVLLFYICGAEGTIYKIVSTHVSTTAHGGRSRALWIPYLKAIVRCVGFMSTVLWETVTLSNTVMLETQGWSFIAYNPVLLSMIILTDAVRIQELIERLAEKNGDIIRRAKVSVEAEAKAVNSLEAEARASLGPAWRQCKMSYEPVEADPVI